MFFKSGENKENNTGGKGGDKLFRSKNWTALIIVVLAFFYFYGFLMEVEHNHGEETLNFRVFAHERPRIVPRVIPGRVIGTHVLQTDYGQINLGNLSRVYVSGNRIIRIDRESFNRGRASHNLAGIPLPVHEINFEHRTNPGNITLIGDADVPPSMDIFLSDGTLISFSSAMNTPWFLYFNNNGTWSLSAEAGRAPFLLIKHPGENDFREYTSITFRQGWGEFIEGL